MEIAHRRERTRSSGSGVFTSNGALGRLGQVPTGVGGRVGVGTISIETRGQGRDVYGIQQYPRPTRSILNKNTPPPPSPPASSSTTFFRPLTRSFAVARNTRNHDEPVHPITTRNTRQSSVFNLLNSNDIDTSLDHTHVTTTSTTSTIPEDRPPVHRYGIAIPKLLCTSDSPHLNQKHTDQRRDNPPVGTQIIPTTLSSLQSDRHFRQIETRPLPKRKTQPGSSFLTVALRNASKLPSPSLTTPIPLIKQTITQEHKVEELSYISPYGPHHTKVNCRAAIKNGIDERSWYTCREGTLKASKRLQDVSGMVEDLRECGVEMSGGGMREGGQNVTPHTLHESPIRNPNTRSTESRLALPATEIDLTTSPTSASNSTIILTPTSLNLKKRKRSIRNEENVYDNDDDKDINDNNDNNAYKHDAIEGGDDSDDGIIPGLEGWRKSKRLAGNTAGTFLVEKPEWKRPKADRGTNITASSTIDLESPSRNIDTLTSSPIAELASQVQNSSPSHQSRASHVATSVTAQSYTRDPVREQLQKDAGRTPDSESEMSDGEEMENVRREREVEWKRMGRGNGIGCWKIDVLEREFQMSSFLSTKRIPMIRDMLNHEMDEEEVKKWFRNRRYRENRTASRWVRKRLSKNRVDDPASKNSGEQKEAAKKAEQELAKEKRTKMNNLRGQINRSVKCQELVKEKGDMFMLDTVQIDIGTWQRWRETSGDEPDFLTYAVPEKELFCWFVKFEGAAYKIQVHFDDLSEIEITRRKTARGGSMTVVFTLKDDCRPSFHVYSDDLKEYMQVADFTSGFGTHVKKHMLCGSSSMIGQILELIDASTILSSLPLHGTDRFTAPAATRRTGRVIPSSGQPRRRNGITAWQRGLPCYSNSGNNWNGSDVSSSRTSLLSPSDSASQHYPYATYPDPPNTQHAYVPGYASGPCPELTYGLTSVPSGPPPTMMDPHGSYARHHARYPDPRSYYPQPCVFPGMYQQQTGYPMGCPAWVTSSTVQIPPPILYGGNPVSMEMQREATISAYQAELDGHIRGVVPKQRDKIIPLNESLLSSHRLPSQTVQKGSSIPDNYDSQMQAYLSNQSSSNHDLLGTDVTDPISGMEPLGSNGEDASQPIACSFCHEYCADKCPGSRAFWKGTGLADKESVETSDINANNLGKTTMGSIEGFSGNGNMVSGGPDSSLLSITGDADAGVIDAATNVFGTDFLDADGYMDIEAFINDDLYGSPGPTLESPAGLDDLLALDHFPTVEEPPMELPQEMLDIEGALRQTNTAMGEDATDENGKTMTEILLKKAEELEKRCKEIEAALQPHSSEEKRRF